ncbi:MAG: beta-ketoacyl-ACP synthase III [Bacteroidota bacterium]
MDRKVYITRVSKFFPNNPVPNEEMEDYLGEIKGLKSRSKSLILHNNKIKTRYYAIDKEGNSTHSVTDMAVEAIKNLCIDDFSIHDIALLTCGSASPDIIMPALSLMVHGKLGIRPLDAMTATGSCNSSMWALNYAWMSLMLGKYSNAVCCASEKFSNWMQSKNFEEESMHLEALGKNPFIAFEKDFLRWMLSDGASAVLLQDQPAKNGLSLAIEWIEIKSFANEIETCMFAGGLKDESGEIVSWHDLTPQQWLENSVFSLRQDTRLLQENITRLGGIFLKELTGKHKFDVSQIDFFLPHLSSYFFKPRIQDSLKDNGMNIPEEKWFVNLDKTGNIASASGFAMLEELFYSGRLKAGNRILMMIPESARFSYTYLMLTVV